MDATALRHLAQLAVDATVDADTPPGAFTWAMAWRDTGPATAFQRAFPVLHPAPKDAWLPEAGQVLARMLLATLVTRPERFHPVPEMGVQWDGPWSAHRSMAAKTAVARVIALGPAALAAPDAWRAPS